MMIFPLQSSNFSWREHIGGGSDVLKMLLTGPERCANLHFCHLTAPKVARYPFRAVEFVMPDDSQLVK